jgi:hypothetical protein
VAALRGFVKEAWAGDGVASAVGLASPSLAAVIAAIVRGDALAPDKAARAAMALARYVVRMRGRATPFGLFAGTALARVGGPADDVGQPGHRPAARADCQWLAALVTALEAAERFFNDRELGTRGRPGQSLASRTRRPRPGKGPVGLRPGGPATARRGSAALACRLRDGW